MINNCLDVAIGRLFAFDDLDLSLATISEVLNLFPMFVEGVPDCTDEFRFMVFGFALWM